MSVYLLEVSYTSASGDTDEAVNRWVWEGDLGSTPRADVVSDLDSFYNVNAGGAVLAVSDAFSTEISRTQPAEVRWYDITGHLDGSPHGSPIAMDTIAAPYALDTDDGLPGQIALVVDYHADLAGSVEFGPGKSRPRSRRRGRHYFGPMRRTGVDIDASTKIPFWHATWVASYGLASGALLSSAHFGPGWRVWSRVDAAVRPVIGGWVDTTPHRARRREEPTNVKVFWPI